jgi:putative transposase
MARLARSTVIGYPHLVTQRGNYDQTVFEEEGDFLRYLSWLSECSKRYSLNIWAYCLMPNHVHFICVPWAEGGLAHNFNTLHMRYAQYYHNKKGVSGHLWRGRFLSCMLDKPSLYEEIRFIENNPVRAGMVGCAEDYPWSSARYHVLGYPDVVIKDDCLIPGEVKDWRVYLADKVDEPILNRTRRSLRTGRPAGDESFVRSLEEILGRRLKALPRGRPRKNVDELIGHHL